MTGPGTGIAPNGPAPEGSWVILQHVAHEGPGLIADELLRADRHRQGGPARPG